MKIKSVMLYVHDVAATVRFYQSAFGFEPSMQLEDGSYAQLDTGEVALAFAIESAGPGQGLPVRLARSDEDAAAVQIAIETDDLEATFARVVEAGGTVVNAPTLRPWGQTVGHVRDLNGFIVEIGTPQSEDWS